MLNYAARKQVNHLNRNRFYLLALKEMLYSVHCTLLFCNAAEKKPEVIDVDEEKSPITAENTTLKTGGPSKPGRMQECLVCKKVSVQ